MNEKLVRHAWPRGRKGADATQSSGHLRLVEAVLDLSDLLKRTAQGDAAAFRQVFELTSTRLFGIAMHVLQDRYLAEHALLDAYLHIRRDAAGHAARADIIEALAAVVRRTSNEMATQVVGIVTRAADPQESGFLFERDHLEWAGALANSRRSPQA